jgi:hypothetical protein
MFDFLKRLVGTPAKETSQPTRRRPKTRKPAGHDPGEPSQAPEVVEGNDHTDWDLWQDSVDSQAAPLTRSSTAFADTTPSQLDDLDPYAKVRRNRDI